MASSQSFQERPPNDVVNDQKRKGRLKLDSYSELQVKKIRWASQGFDSVMSIATQVIKSKRSANVTHFTDP